MENANNSTAIEARMLWTSLRRQPDGMSDIELTLLWAPTWSHKQVKGLLEELVRTGMARTDDRRACGRYIACEPTAKARQHHQGAA